MGRKQVLFWKGAPLGLLCLASFSPATTTVPQAPIAAYSEEHGRTGRGHLALPQPEALAFLPIGADRARLINSAIPMGVTGSAAAPFALAGDLASRARAVDCLAGAMWYEAGSDSRGQRAVGQVVLNRVRHPSFPSSVCGVVFQGSERKTGCQFTFTCDGALAKRPSERQFAAARAIAFSLLTGEVDREVGLATHYHTDWVHPAWSAQLAKIAKVDTHLFFRWAGYWGAPGAMTQAYSGREPVVESLAFLSPIHRMALSAEAAPTATTEPELALEATGVTLALASPRAAEPDEARQAGVFDLTMNPAESGGAQALAALDLCGDRDFCKVVGRLGGTAQDRVAFLFVRDRRTGVEQALWDCESFPRKDAGQCLSASGRGWLDFNGNLQSGRPNART